MSSRVTKVLPFMLVAVLLVTSALPVLAGPSRADKTIVDIAVADGRFKTLVTGLQAADLVSTLQGAGPFTVFAPTDDAFAKLPAGTVESLLADVPTLKNILLYHVVSGKVMAADVVKLSSANTVSGQPVTIKVEGDKVMVNDAQVVITDIEASNGVIHVIDTVLLPPAEAPAALPATGGEMPSNMWMLVAVGLGLLVAGLGLRLLRPVWLAEKH